MQCGIANAMVERGCVESDEISRSDETKSRAWEFLLGRFGAGLRVKGIRGLCFSP